MLYIHFVLRSQADPQAADPAEVLPPRSRLATLPRSSHRRPSDMPTSSDESTARPVSESEDSRGRIKKNWRKKHDANVGAVDV